MFGRVVYESGQFFVAHQDSEKADDMIGTLVAILPSALPGSPSSRRMPIQVRLERSVPIPLIERDRRRNFPRVADAAIEPRLVLVTVAREQAAAQSLIAVDEVIGSVVLAHALTSRRRSLHDAVRYVAKRAAGAEVDEEPVRSAVGDDIGASREYNVVTPALKPRRS